MNAIVRAGLQFSRAHRRLWLLWVCPRAVVFARLHANILREVTSYLAQFQMLIYLVHSSVFSLVAIDVYSRNKPWFSIHTPRLADGPSFASVDYLKFILTGGVKRTAIDGEYQRGVSAAVYLWTNRGTSPLCDMIEGRFLHTLVYVEREHALFAFGGYDLNHEPLRTCEKYTFATNSWAPLPKMSAVRPLPRVSQHRDFLYVCGVHDNSAIDRFDMRNNQWMQVYVWSDRIRADFVLFADENSLLLLGEDIGKRFDFATQSWRAVSPLGLCVRGITSGVKVNQLAFVLIEDCFCACVDLTSGLRKREFDFETNR